MAIFEIVLRIWRVHFGVLAVVIACLASTAPASAREVPAGFFGVMADGPLTDGTVALGPELQRMRQSGVETVRVVFDWAAAQPSAGGAFDFRQTDAFVAAASRAGLRVLPVVNHAPAWAVRAPAQYGSAPKDPKKFAAYAAALVKRYGPKGDFTRSNGSRPIRMWQVWNEPSLPFFWTGRPWPKTYVKLLKVTRKAIRKADKGADILLAGLTNGAGEPAWDALKKLYKAGARGHFDAVAVHPYTRQASGVVETVRRVRKVMDARRNRRVPVLVTETSWSSSNGIVKTQSVTWDGSEAYQAAALTRVMKALVRNRKKLRIKMVCWYSWLSPESRDKAWSLYAGLNRMDDGQVVVKPALRAFSRAALPLQRR